MMNENLDEALATTEAQTEEYCIAAAARGGDAESLSLLVDRWRQRLFSLAYAELRHYQDAEDAVAQSLLQMCRGLPALRDPGHFRAWVNAIVRNECRQIRRRPRAVSLDEVDAPARDECVVLRADIDRALKRLPNDQAEAIAQHYLVGLSISEIALRLGRPPATVKTWLRRGRARMALQMEGYNMVEERATQEFPGRGAAAILQSGLDAEAVKQISAALRENGWSDVRVPAATEDWFRPEAREQNGQKEFSMPGAHRDVGLVVANWKIGERTALELLGALRMVPETRAVPVIVLGPSDDVSIFAAWTAGADCYLTHPFSSEEVGKYAGILKQRSAP